MMIIEKNNVTVDIISDFIFRVDKDFTTPISSKVNILEYAQKIIDLANVYTLENDVNSYPIGMGVCYCNDFENQKAYLSFLAIEEKYRGFGFSNQLLDAIINDVKKTSMRCIELHTESPIAEKLYISKGFKVIEDINDRKKMSLLI